jgi:hypothetical protein
VVAGEKEDDELGGGLKLLSVIFGAEGVDVTADFLGVVGEGGGAGELAAGFGLGELLRGPLRMELGEIGAKLRGLKCGDF